jgi:hypothetical protein
MGRRYAAWVARWTVRTAARVLAIPGNVLLAVLAYLFLNLYFTDDAEGPKAPLYWGLATGTVSLLNVITLALRWPGKFLSWTAVTATTVWCGADVTRAARKGNPLSNPAIAIELLVTFVTIVAVLGRLRAEASNPRPPSWPRRWSAGG